MRVPGLRRGECLQIMDPCRACMQYSISTGSSPGTLYLFTKFKGLCNQKMDACGCFKADSSIFFFFYSIYLNKSAFRPVNKK